MLDMIEHDVFLWEGVPERPSAVYGRDGNDHVLSRGGLTRESLDADLTPTDGARHVFERMRVNFETGEITFSKFEPLKGAD